MGSETNSQQAPVYWLREITKAKVRQAKPFFIHKNEKIGGKRHLDNFRQFWASLSKFGQVQTSQDKAKNQKNGKNRQKEKEKGTKI